MRRERRTEEELEKEEKENYYKIQLENVGIKISIESAKEIIEQKKLNRKKGIQKKITELKNKITLLVEMAKDEYD